MEYSAQTRSRSIFTFLWIAFAIFIVYGTIIPFNLVSSKELITQNISQIVWTPFVDPDGSRASIPDILQNILLFIPYGFFGFMVFSPKIQGQLTQKGVIIFFVSLLGLALSTCVEFLQLFAMDRVTSVTDLVTNTLGTFTGASGACMFAETLLRTLKSSRVQKAFYSHSFYPLLLAFIVIIIGALQPFDFALDVGRIGSRVLRILKNPFDFSLTLRDEPFLFFRFLLFGYLASLWFDEIGQPNAKQKSVALSTFTAIFFEGSQIFTKSHVPGLQDTLVMILGGVFGAMFMQSITRRNSPGVLCIFIVVATFITSAIQVLSPFQFATDYRPMNWIPFLPYFARNFITALGMFIEGLLIFFPLGFVLRLLLPKTTKHLIVIGLIGLGIAVPTELVQGWIIDRYPDITDILGSIIGTLVGAWCGYSGWEMIDRHLALEEDDCPTNCWPEETT